MPGSIWGLVSPKLTLWVGTDAVKVFAPTGDAASVDTDNCYQRGEIIEPRGLARALVHAYKVHSHRSYGIAPYVRAIVPPGTTPAGLFVWDAVLRTSGASDWVIEDAGLRYTEAMRHERVEARRIEALLCLYKSCVAWELVRRSEKALEVVTAGRVPAGTGDGVQQEVLSAMLRQSATDRVRQAVRHMVEDEVAQVAAAPVLVLTEGAPSDFEQAAQACAEALKSVLGGGGEVKVGALPTPEALLGLPGGNSPEG